MGLLTRGKEMTRETNRIEMRTRTAATVVDALGIHQVHLLLPSPPKVFRDRQRSRHFLECKGSFLDEQVLALLVRERLAFGTDASAFLAMVETNADKRGGTCIGRIRFGRDAKVEDVLIAVSIVRHLGAHRLDANMLNMGNAQSLP